MLPWHVNCRLPSARRDQARSRTAQLGLDSLEATPAGKSNTQPGTTSLNAEYEAAKKAAGLPSNICTSESSHLRLGRKQDISGLLGSPVYTTRFRLDALANDLLEPLARLLDKKDHLLEGENPSSLDCLAFGYLSLMLYPDLPQAWLTEVIQKRHPKLVKYIWRMREDLLGGEQTNLADVQSIASCKGNETQVREYLERLGTYLPWHPADAGAAPRKPPSRRTFFGNFVLPSLAVSGPLSPHKLWHIPPPPASFAVNALAATSAALLSVLAGIVIFNRRFPREGGLLFRSPL